MSDAPWYAEGLAFACTRCGNCCTGAPGSVRVDEREAEELAAFVGVDLATFHERFLRLLGDGAVSLVEKPNHDCVFWSAEHGCTVYPVRPRQCRTWPFWRANLASPRHWAAAARGCPGIGRGAVRGRDEIERALGDDGTSGVVPQVE